MCFSRKTSRCAMLLPVATLLLAFSAGSAAQIPDGLKGTWQVAEVHINTESSRTVSYGWNDPRLRWRMFTFSDTQITDDAPEDGNCQAPRATAKRLRLTQLFGESLAGDGYPVQPATPADYAFKIDPAEVADVISITCRSGPWQGGLGADGGLQGAWMYVASDGHLVLRWYDESILVLTHLDASAKPDASFDCAKATSSTEQAICSSLQLASFDQSVALAYQQLRDQARQVGDSLKALATSQRAWIRQRNACGADAKCILKSLKERLDRLASADQS